MDYEKNVLEVMEENMSDQLAEAAYQDMCENYQQVSLGYAGEPSKWEELV